MQIIQQKHPSLTVLAVVIGTFMSSFDISIVNMALPIIQSHFQVAISSIQWIVVAYLLALSATQLSFGRISDMIGHKRIYLAGFTAFTLFSLVCALAPSLTLLTVFRIFQALGAAMMTSSSSPIILAAVSPQNRGKSLGMLAIAVAVSTCLGPSLGGLMAASLGWNSIFFINVPIGVLGILFAAKVIANDAKISTGKRFDPVGSGLFILALSLVLLPLSLSSQSAVHPALLLIVLAGGFAFLLLFLVVEKKIKQPLLDLNLFQNKTFSAGNFAAMFFYMSEFVMVFLAPYYIQKMLMLPAAVSGILMLPMSVGMMIAAPLGGAVSDRFGNRYISFIGLALMIGGLLWLSSFDATTSVLHLGAAMFLFGFGGGLFQTPNTNAVLGSVPANRRGVSSASLGTMRNVGMVSGEAISAALITFSMSKAAPALTAQGFTGTQLWQGEFSPAMRITCLIAALCAVAALALSLVKSKVSLAKHCDGNTGKNEGFSTVNSAGPDTKQNS